MSKPTKYNGLYRYVCVGLGFCGCLKDGRPLRVSDFIPSSGPVTADQYAEWVFLADNINPIPDTQRWKQMKSDIRAAFVEHMGAEVVDASKLRLRDN